MSKLREEYEKETGLEANYYWFQKYGGASLEKHVFNDEYVEWLEQKLQSQAPQSEENDLNHLYEWLMNENREPAQTKFTSGMLRNVAKEIEFRLSKDREEILSDMMSKDEDLGLYDGGEKECDCEKQIEKYKDIAQKHYDKLRKATENLQDNEFKILDLCMHSEIILKKGEPSKEVLKKVLEIVSN